MGKITFRADDELVDELESLEASKSEVMREALRTYLDTHARGPSGRPRQSSTRRGSDVDDRVGALLDELVRERVDDVLAHRADGPRARGPREAPDVNVTISLEGDDGRLTAVEHSAEPSHTPEPGREVEPGDADRSCDQCGEQLDASHVFCPNCGEKAARRLFCECGDEIRSDWAFCPSCGRRTPAADVLDSERV